MATSEDAPTQPIAIAPRIVAVPTGYPVAWMPSPHCSSVPRKLTQFVVVHCTDGHEGPSKAEDVARMLADPLLKPRRSAHYVCDSDSIVQCVRNDWQAWHAGHTANRRGVGVEITGRANQTDEQWLDDVSLATLARASRVVADLCAAYQLPRAFVRAGELVAGVRGITTHAEVSKAWRETTHTDPGPYFPLDAFVRAVVGA